MKTNESNTVTLKSPLSVPRMRTLNKALEEIRSVDPDTAISMRAIRRMIANGELQVYYVGKKRLINLDMLFEALYCHYSTEDIVPAGIFE